MLPPRLVNDNRLMQVNGRELAVEVEGEGPAVLLVHGLGGTSNFYQVQADALAEELESKVSACAVAPVVVMHAGH